MFSSLAKIFVEVISFIINGISDWPLKSFFDVTSDFCMVMLYLYSIIG